MGTAQFLELTDDVRIAFDDAGSGDPPIMFVHGWCCQRWYLRPQFEHFAGRQRAVAVDLRGHGDSDVPADGEFTIEQHADDLAELCRRIGLRRPVLVGHSMGGAVALAVAARHPEVPAAIVMLDGAVFFPPQLVASIPALVASWRAAEFPECLRPFVDGMFLASDDPALRRRITEDMLARPRHVVLAELESLAAFDSAAAASACTVPALYVGSAEPVADMAKMRELMPGCLRAQTAGAGHFHQLEVPEQVNAMIERFLAVSGLQDGAP